MTADISGLKTEISSGHASPSTVFADERNRVSA